MGEELKIKISADDKASGVLKGVQGALGGLGNVAGTVLKAGVIGAAAGFGALTAGIGMSVKAAMDAQKVDAQLAAVLKSTKGVAGVTADQVNKLADSLSELTPFEDEAIKSGESLLLTFTNIGKDVFPDATETMLDMSQALGQDLKSSAIQLGKALNDPIQGVSALQRVGVSFTEAQKEQIKVLVESGKTQEAQKLILKELQTEFGGAAKAAGQTFAGQMQILQNQFGNVQETIGMAFLPMLAQLSGFINQNILPAFKAFAEDAAPKIQAALQNLATWVNTNVLPVFTAIVTAIQTGDFGRIGEIVGGILSNLLTMAGTKLGELLAAFKTWATSPATKVELEKLGADIGDFIVDGVSALFSKDKSGTMGPLGTALSNAAEGAGAVFQAVGGQIAQKILQGMVTFFTSPEFKRHVISSIMSNFGQSPYTAQYNAIINSLFPNQTLAPGSATGTSGFGSYANGGIIPGPLGSPQLVVAHGGEEFLGVGASRRSGGAYVTVGFDQEAFIRWLQPMIEAGVLVANRAQAFQ